jgi:hypothetical protein
MDVSDRAGAAAGVVVPNRMDWTDEQSKIAREQFLLITGTLQSVICSGVPHYQPEFFSASGESWLTGSEAIHY